MPRWQATALAKGASLKLLSLNPIEKLFICCPDNDCINAVTSDESMPPDKKTPTGTSARHTHWKDARRFHSNPQSVVVGRLHGKYITQCHDGIYRRSEHGDRRLGYYLVQSDVRESKDKYDRSKNARCQEGMFRVYSSS